MEAEAVTDFCRRPQRNDILQRIPYLRTTRQKPGKRMPYLPVIRNNRV